MNDNEIKLEELKDLIDNTQLLWKINNPKDPYLNDYLEKKETLKKKADLVIEGSKINGFIASVEKPSMLKIPTGCRMYTVPTKRVGMRSLPGRTISVLPTVT